MSNVNPEINLVPVGNIGGLSRLVDARYLSAAAKTNIQLAQELPLVVRNYGRVLRAAHRLGVAARNAEHTDNLYDAFVIYDSETPVGMASVEARQPSPVKLTGNGLEVSYWHSRLSEERARAIGTTVIYRSEEIAQRAGLTPWMVTLTKDHIKRDALRQIGFVPEGPVRQYDLDDDCLEPRQLWVTNPHAPLTLEAEAAKL